MIKKILILVICFIIGFEGMASANAAVVAACAASASASAASSAALHNHTYNHSTGSVLIPFCDDKPVIDSFEFQYLLKIANKIYNNPDIVNGKKVYMDKEIVAITAINFVFGNIEGYDNYRIYRKVAVIKALVNNMKLEKVGK